MILYTPGQSYFRNSSILSWPRALANLRASWKLNFTPANNRCEDLLAGIEKNAFIDEILINKKSTSQNWKKIDKFGDTNIDIQISLNLCL